VFAGYAQTLREGHACLSLPKIPRTPQRSASSRSNSSTRPWTTSVDVLWPCAFPKSNSYRSFAGRAARDDSGTHALWGTGYDFGWVAQRRNAQPQFVTEIDGLDIHFIHAKSDHENALPLITTHGWPGSVIEMLTSSARARAMSAVLGDLDALAQDHADEFLTDRLAGHLGVDRRRLPVLSHEFPIYQVVDVQVAFESWRKWLTMTALTEPSPDLLSEFCHPESPVS
jgi:hypothetical protein